MPELTYYVGCVLGVIFMPLLLTKYASNKIADHCKDKSKETMKFLNDETQRLYKEADKLEPYPYYYHR